ncbi:ABC transporter ATP-binding protein [Candidatus Berkelbacteria bacterium]|nr:ABC transporter ATP-binding protein [Candidatus Berkelbacteria bacterium]
MNPIIEAEKITKTFKLPHEKVDSLREGIATFYKPKTYETFMALQDVSFDVKEGEFLGIIGRNGSGKSTLLKILAGIYQPDNGKVKIKGKISPFLELGVGFNPELTARENVFLNGIVLGLSHRQIEKKYPGIVEFAGLEKFMDAKLKNFSSGMQVRLAFSVAKEAPADIFLIDEALAVGDVEFQEKCLGLFYGLKKAGKTIIFVSHDLGTMQDIADRILLLEQGNILKIDQPRAAINQYHLLSSRTSLKGQKKDEHQFNKKEVKITDVQFQNSQGKTNRIFKTGENIEIKIFYLARKPVKNPVVGLALYNYKGVHINGPNTKTSHFPIPEVTGKGAILYRIRKNPFLAGEYFLTCGIFDESCQFAFDFIDKGFSFRVLPNLENQHGTVKLKEEWQILK